MSMNLKKIEEEARRLSETDRAKLAEHLISTLDQGTDIDAEKAWIEEAEKRYEMFKEGKLKTISAEKVFEDAYKKLNEKY